MPLELLEEYPATDDREQMGRLLRHAFPLGLGSFTELPEALKGVETSEEDSSEGSREASGSTSSNFR